MRSLALRQGCRPLPLSYPQLPEAGPGMSSAEGLRSESLGLPASSNNPTLGLVCIHSCRPMTGLVDTESSLPTLPPLLKAIVFRPSTSALSPPVLRGISGVRSGQEETLEMASPSSLQIRLHCPWAKINTTSEGEASPCSVLRAKWPGYGGGGLSISLPQGSLQLSSQRSVAERQPGQRPRS